VSLTAGGPEALPTDAKLVGLWPERLTFETRHCLLPGTAVSFQLVLEGHALPLTLVSEACLVVAKDKQGYVFHAQLPLEPLSQSERQLVALFIQKGRGAPRLERLAQPR
jgi:hypothetical protein